MNEKKFANTIWDRYQKLKTSQNDIFDDADFFYALYRAALEWDETYPWDYTLVDPVVFQLLRDYMARLNPEGFRVDLASRSSKAVSKRKHNQQILDWELSEMAKAQTYLRLLFGGLLRGVSYAETCWKYEKAIKILGGKKGEKEREVNMKNITNRADVKYIRFTDMFFPDQNNPDLYTQPYIIQRVLEKFGDMEDRNKLDEEKPFWKKKYLEKIKKTRLFSNKVDYGNDLPIDDGDKEDSFTRSQYVAMLKYSTIDGEVFYILEDDNKGWILNEDTENPYWHGHYPYLAFAPFPEDERFFTQGIVRPVADLAVALTATLNQFMTNSRKAGNPMWMVGKDGAKTPDWQFVNRPDGIVRINGDINQVQQIRPVDTGKTLITARQELSTAFEKTTGMSSMYTSGVSAGSSPQINKTASGARIIDANISQNLQAIIAIFGQQIVAKIGEHFLELNAQYMTEEQEIRITDEPNAEQFLKVDPTEVSADFDVRAKADTVLKENPVVTQASLLNLKATIDQEKDVKINKVPVWQKIMETFPTMDSADDIILDPEGVANEAINSIMNYDAVPEAPWNIDHKAVIQIVQKYMMANELDDKKLTMFADYIEDLKEWIQAANPNLFTQPPVQQGMMPGMQPQMGGGMPITEEGLEASATGMMPQNPTMSLPNSIPMDAMGAGDGLPI